MNPSDRVSPVESAVDVNRSGHTPISAPAADARDDPSGSQEVGIEAAAIVTQFVLFGTSIALLGASFLPVPEYMSGPHPVILESQGTLVRLEPREKAFYVASVLIGGGCGLLGSLLAFRSLLGVSLGLHAVILACQVPFANFLMGESLNSANGSWYAACSLAGSVLSIATLGWVARRSRPLCRRDLS